jgi:hypothetical protein
MSCWCCNVFHKQKESSKTDGTLEVPLLDAGVFSTSSPAAICVSKNGREESLGTSRRFSSPLKHNASRYATIAGSMDKTMRSNASRHHGRSISTSGRISTTAMRNKLRTSLSDREHDPGDTSSSSTTIDQPKSLFSTIITPPRLPKDKTAVSGGSLNKDRSTEKRERLQVKRMIKSSHE